jgi:hypothetical protein
MRTRLFYFAIIAVLLAVAPRLGLSQEKSTESKTAAARQPAPKHYYKLNLVLRETDDGKVLNQRIFSMDISAEPPGANGVPLEWWNMRSGTRVPVSGSKDIEVGVNLDVRAEEVAEGLQMQITSEISSLGAESGGGPPAIRQVKVRSAVLARIGKPTVVFTADDPASKRRLELEVTPTREP